MVPCEPYTNGDASEQATTLLDEYIKDNVESASWDARRANAVFLALSNIADPQGNERHIVLRQNFVVANGPVVLSTLAGFYQCLPGVEPEAPDGDLLTLRSPFHNKLGRWTE